VEVTSEAASTPKLQMVSNLITLILLGRGTFFPMLNYYGDIWRSGVIALPSLTSELGAMSFQPHAQAVLPPRPIR
jgi:hypothetical protein